jgi:hypothetical protein
VFSFAALLFFSPQIEMEMGKFYFQSLQTFRSSSLYLLCIPPLGMHIKQSAARSILLTLLLFFLRLILLYIFYLFFFFFFFPLCVWPSDDRLGGVIELCRFRPRALSDCCRRPCLERERGTQHTVHGLVFRWMD